MRPLRFAALSSRLVCDVACAIVLLVPPSALGAPPQNKAPQGPHRVLAPAWPHASALLEASAAQGPSERSDGVDGPPALSPPDADAGANKNKAPQPGAHDTDADKPDAPATSDAKKPTAPKAADLPAGRDTTGTVPPPGRDADGTKPVAPKSADASAGRDKPAAPSPSGKSAATEKSLAPAGLPPGQAVAPPKPAAPAPPNPSTSPDSTAPPQRPDPSRVPTPQASASPNDTTAADAKPSLPGGPSQASVPPKAATLPFVKADDFRKPPVAAAPSSHDAPSTQSSSLTTQSAVDPAARANPVKGTVSAPAHDKPMLDKNLPLTKAEPGSTASSQRSDAPQVPTPQASASPNDTTAADAKSSLPGGPSQASVPPKAATLPFVKADDFHKPPVAAAPSSQGSSLATESAVDQAARANPVQATASAPAHDKLVLDKNLPLPKAEPGSTASSQRSDAPHALALQALASPNDMTAADAKPSLPGGPSQASVPPKAATLPFVKADDFHKPPVAAAPSSHDAPSTQSSSVATEFGVDPAARANPVKVTVSAPAHDKPMLDENVPLTKAESTARPLGADATTAPKKAANPVEPSAPAVRPLRVAQPAPSDVGVAEKGVAQPVDGKPPVAASIDTAKMLTPPLAPKAAKRLQAPTHPDSVVHDDPTPAFLSSSLPGVAEQPNTVAMQPNAVAMQPNAVATQPNAVAMQPDAVAMQPNAVAMQPDAVAMQPNAVAMQPNAVVVQPNAVAMQPNVTASPSRVTPKPHKDAPSMGLDFEAPFSNTPWGTRGTFRLNSAYPVRPGALALALSEQYAETSSAFIRGDALGLSSQSIALSASPMLGLNLGISLNSLAAKYKSLSPRNIQLQGNPTFMASYGRHVARGLAVGGRLQWQVPTSAFGSGLAPSASTLLLQGMASYQFLGAIELIFNLGYQLDRSRTLFGTQGADAVQRFVYGINQGDSVAFGLGATGQINLGKYVAFAPFVEATEALGIGPGADFANSPFMITPGIKVFDGPRRAIEVSAGSDIRILGGPSLAKTYASVPPWRIFGQVTFHLGEATRVCQDENKVAKPQVPWIIAGDVLDAESNQPVVGATINFSINSEATLAVDDAKGTFVSWPLQRPKMDKQPAMTLVGLTARAPGYHETTLALAPPLEGGTVQTSIKLVRDGDKSAFGTLRGSVRNGRTGLAIAKAILTFEGANEAVHADNQGNFATRVKAGHIGVDIKAPSFGVQHKELTVRSGETVILNVDLIQDGTGVAPPAP